MDNYEVNVLTRKGGWKNLPQEVIKNKDEIYIPELIFGHLLTSSN